MFLRAFWSACCGNAFEHYDSALFGFLAPFLAPQIFPESDYLSALILTYAMIPLGMLARPLGALFFGCIGDKRGRKAALYWSMMGMGLVTVATAACPTYATAGLLSPLLFCVSRVLQNFFSAGESMGGGIYLLEECTQKEQDWMSGLYNASTMAGIILASCGVAFFAEQWRLLYLFGSITCFFALLLRRGAHFRQKQAISFSQIDWAAFLAIALCSGFSYASYLMTFAVISNLVPAMMEINTWLLVFDFATLPLFGLLAAKIGRERQMLFSALCVIIFAPLFVSLLHSASFFAIVYMRCLLVCFGVAFFAPFHAWCKTITAPQLRYSTISLAYALGVQLFGGPTASFALWNYRETGLLVSATWYWVFLALASSFAIFSLQKAPKHEHS